jgi:predicted O-methyltransferase YrrM
MAGVVGRLLSSRYSVLARLLEEWLDMTVRWRGALLTGAAGVLVSVLLLTWLVVAGATPWYVAVLLLLTEILLVALAYAVLLLRSLHSRMARVHSFLGRHERRESRARHAAREQQNSVERVSKDVMRVGAQVEGLLAAASQDRAETVMAIEEMDELLSGLTEKVQTVGSDADTFRAETHSRVDGLETEVRQVHTAVDTLKAPLEKFGAPEVVLRRNQAEFAQIEALLDLRSLLRPRAPMPPSRGWAAAPTSILEYVKHILERKPSTVVECGSGVSSVWAGYALESIGAGRCVALEHDPEYAEATRRELERHGLTAWVDVRTAPLRRVAVGEREYDWYDVSCVSDLHDIDVVFVDGPPAATGRVARYPAMPLLRDRCTSDAVLILDDAARPEEKEILEMWADSDAQLWANSPAEKGWATVRLSSR